MIPPPGSASASGPGAAATAPAAGPPPRDGFGAVYRGLDQTLYVLGGLDAAGQATDDLWRHDALGWTPLPLSLPGPEQVGEVLAMALRPLDPSLYALVRLVPVAGRRGRGRRGPVRRGPERTARRRPRPRAQLAMLRLPLDGSGVQVLGRFPVRPRFTRHAMVFDDAGRLLVLAAGRHRALVIRTDPDDLDGVSALGRIRGRVASDVVYDGGGLSFLLRGRRGALVAGGLADEALWTGSGRFGDCL